MKKSGSDINELIGLIAEGHFEQYNGLGEEWTISVLEKIYGTKLKCSSYFLSGKTFTRCDVQIQLQTQPLQCFAQATGDIMLLRLEDALMKISLEEFIKICGEPELKRNLAYPEKYSPSTQWIYASKGITLYILNESTTSRQLICVAFYKKTSTIDYLENWGGNETLKYFAD